MTVDQLNEDHTLTLRLVIQSNGTTHQFSAHHDSFVLLISFILFELKVLLGVDGPLFIHRKGEQMCLDVSHSTNQTKHVSRWCFVLTTSVFERDGTMLTAVHTFWDKQDADLVGIDHKRKSSREALTLYNGR